MKKVKGLFLKLIILICGFIGFIMRYLEKAEMESQGYKFYKMPFAFGKAYMVASPNPNKLYAK